jgi:hypothetical protein
MPEVTIQQSQPHEVSAEPASYLECNNQVIVTPAVKEFVFLKVPIAVIHHFDLYPSLLALCVVQVLNI